VWAWGAPAQTRHRMEHRASLQRWASGPPALRLIRNALSADVANPHACWFIHPPPPAGARPAVGRQRNPKLPRGQRRAVKGGCGGSEAQSVESIAVSLTFLKKSSTACRKNTQCPSLMLLRHKGMSEGEEEKKRKRRKRKLAVTALVSDSTAGICPEEAEEVQAQSSGPTCVQQGREAKIWLSNCIRPAFGEGPGLAICPSNWLRPSSLPLPPPLQDPTPSQHDVLAERPQHLPRGG